MNEPPSPPPSAPLVRSQPSSYAIASLVLGILGFVALPIVGSILAIVHAGNADGDIAASGGGLGSKGFADAGRLLGNIGLVLAVIAIVVIVLAIVALN